MKHGHYAPNQSNHITMFVLDAQGIKVVPKSFPKSFSCQACLYKPRGGQKAYKGHFITLPQDAQQLADVLPRCPQELPVIIFTIAGKDNKSRDF